MYNNTYLQSGMLTAKNMENIRKCKKKHLPISNSIFSKEVQDHMDFFGDSDNITLELTETI